MYRYQYLVVGIPFALGIITLVAGILDRPVDMTSSIIPICEHFHMSNLNPNPCD